MLRSVVLGQAVKPSLVRACGYGYAQQAVSHVEGFVCLLYSLKVERVDPLDGASVHEHLAFQGPDHMFSQDSSATATAKLKRRGRSGPAS